MQRMPKESGFGKIPADTRDISPEGAFYGFIETLDESTRKTPGYLRIVEEVENTGDFSKAIEKLKHLKEKRNAALDRVIIHRAETAHNLDQAGIDAMVGEIRLAISYPERFLGNGASCDVFTLRESNITNKLTCVKVVRDYQKYAEGHTLLNEMEILDSIHDIDVEGVRTPEPLFAFSSIRIDGMVMEHLDAVNFRRVIEGQTTEGVKDTIPPAFDVDVYFSRLRKYTDVMHARGVVHNDLHLRNLMIHRVTGLPYVIDFGKAIVESAIDKTKTSLEDIIKRDDATLDRAETEARKWLSKKA